MKNPFPHIDAFHAHGLYLPTWTIYLDHLTREEPGQEVESEVAAKFIKNIHVLRSMNEYRPLTVLIHSFGGCVDSGMAIYDAIRSYPGEVTTRAVGAAQSIAAVILQAGDKRQAMKHSVIMVHDGSIELAGELRNIKDRVDFEDRLRLGYYHLLKERSGKDAKYWNRVHAKDKWYTAEQALADGLIDEIVE